MIYSLLICKQFLNKEKKHETLAVKSQCHLQGGVVGVSNQQNQNKINDNCGERAKCVATTKTDASRAKNVIIATTNATSTDVNCLINKFSQ